MKNANLRCFTMEPFRRVIICNLPEHEFMADAHLANVVGTARCEKTCTQIKVFKLSDLNIYITINVQR